MNTAKKFTGLDIITVGFIVACCAQPAQGGWTGAMNGIGYGQVTVNVRAYDTLASKTRYVTTTNMVSPSAAIKITEGYVFGAPLPQDASPATVAKVKGLPGYIWQATTVGSDGDSTDNIELENRITITAADCAALEMSSSVIYNDPGETNGLMIINAKATAGAAFWTRGIEYVGALPENIQPEYDENGDIIGGFTDEFKEFLKANGTLKWDVLYVGPFDLSDECSAIKIPFNTTDKTNLYFLTDGVAKSLPLVIECPSDIVVECGGTPAQYPETVLVGGCGDISVTFDPESPPTEVGTHIVTVAATDSNDNTASCTFKVIIKGSTFDGFYSPINGTGGSCGSPIRTVKLGSKIPIKFTSSCGDVISGDGTPPKFEITKCEDTNFYLEGECQFVAGQWHANFDTSQIGVNTGDYTIIVTLQDGITQKSAVIRLK